MFESEGRLFTEDGDMLEIKSVGYASTFCPRPYSAELTIKAVTCRNSEGKALKRFPVISRVIFSGPATIVFWDDGVKTVSKCDAKDQARRRDSGRRVVMSLYLKESIDPQKLEDYGFERADKVKARGVRVDFPDDSYIKFAEDEEKPGIPCYADDEIPLCQLSFLLRPNGRMCMYNDCAPSCTYHVGGADIEVLEKTLFDLVTDGLIVWEG